MFRALRWSFLLFLGFLVVTQQVLSNGPLVNFDNNVNHTHHPQFSGFAGFVLRRLDDLGLRWLTATVLIIAATYISYKFKTWRPINLAVLSVLALNFVVGVFKLFLGRTKPRDGFDLLHAGGMSYPSGHASNAVLSWGILAYLIYRYARVDKYQGRLASAAVVAISLTICIVSLIRHTHWFTDLLGGLFIGGALLVAVIAVDRYVPSESQLH
ncbi:MAG: phosphatase PAP2 family protein [Actinobacteria bacterium]|nr:phosphatase PAP2 family protein [Actinomycetota bacterium]MSW63032.1 phosphatase PAP2 family protein [Actinomycetota bacterium]MSX90080.1 phosphatase PAP2 family protein [Actinomycetota bacterium]MSZ64535.1 phosphatase PAP2 family protein [Actinomycetota bacterium]MTA58206.1 phosphatase PAP2 family protein [Actinomycetota bacterium]